MKSKILVLFTFLALSFMITQGCGHKHDHSNEEQQGKEYTSAYICPMHCEGSGSDKAGTCPACGMDYVVNEDHKEDGHDHEEDGHEH